MADITYLEYVRLPELLSLQRSVESQGAFYSHQFREIEILLGIMESVSGEQYIQSLERIGSAKRGASADQMWERICAVRHEPSLRTAIYDWLAEFPICDVEGGAECGGAS